MNLYGLRLTLQSPVGTPLAADTLFGHLCWGIRYRSGVDRLKEFLDTYESSEPALLLSDPFPTGFWPIPLLPQPLPDQEDTLIDLIRQQPQRELARRLPDSPLSEVSDTPQISCIQAFDLFKWLNRLRWIAAPTLAQLAGSMSRMAVLRHFILHGCGDPHMPIQAAVAHNTINRLTNTVLESGGFYFTTDQWVSPEEPVPFHILVASGAYSPQEIIGLFQDALSGGYGRDKSTGKGRIAVGPIEPFGGFAVADPNAVMLLGPCAPTAADPAEGYWRVFTRYGKLGGNWATDPGPGGTCNPFKRPLTMLKSGSVLLTDNPRLWYGRLVDEMHPDWAEVRHYGLAIALPIHCDLKGLP